MSKKPQNNGPPRLGGPQPSHLDGPPDSITSWLLTIPPPPAEEKVLLGL